MDHTRWIEIDCDALIHNLNLIRGHITEGVKLLAVVKADAYGLGAGPVARLFEEQGVDMLGVTNLEEGIALRREGVTLPILLFAPLLPQEASVAVNYKLTPTVDSFETLKGLQASLEKGKTFPVHVKVETGMGRTGLQPQEAYSFCCHIKEKFPQIYLEGIFSHFAQGARGDAYTQEQFKRFQRLMEELEKGEIRIPLKHIANSVATLELAETHLDMVRVGTILYGQHPARAMTRLALKEPWKPKARIIHISQVARGTSIGYGRDYRTKKDTYIGVIPLGYADGLGLSAVARPKNLLDLIKTLAKTFLAYWGKGSQALNVRYRGQLLPLVGRLGMQLSMIEVGDMPLKEGEVVEVPLGRITANPSLPRVYLREGQVVAERRLVPKLGIIDYQ